MGRDGVRSLMSSSAQFDVLAEFLDVAWDADEHEIEFWVSELQGCEQPVMELGVGTGRVALALARRGVSVIGIDSSLTMLRSALRKSSRYKDLLLLECANASELPIMPSSVSTIVAPGLFYHIPVLEEYRRIYASCFDALRPGGRFIFDVEARKDGGWGGDGVLRLLGDLAREDGSHKTLYGASYVIEEKQQHRGVFITELSDASGGVVERSSHHLTASYISFEQGHELATGAGFEIQAVWGDYQKTPFSAGAREMIWSLVRPA